MNHLESLISEYLEWSGYLIRRNVKVGRLSHGGYAMELDVIGYNPHSNHLVHYEPSIDGRSWDEREKRFRAKFENAKKFILPEVFSWLPTELDIEQIAICVSHPPSRSTIGGGKLISLDEFIKEVRDKVIAEGPANSKAISEIYPLLRTIQLSHSGYNKTVL